MLVLLFIEFSFKDLLDIFLVAIIIYQLYLLTKGTTAIKIFLGILAIYLLWKLVSAFQMEMLEEILGQFIGVGVIALIIVFQQELRKFLLFIGNRDFFKRKSALGKWFGNNLSGEEDEFNDLASACARMSSSKTGALIVLTNQSDLNHYITSQTNLDATLSAPLLESIFFKNSPLHDGAVLVNGNRIISARGVLPVSSQNSIGDNLGMRHRAAVGITEDTDAVAIVVSEETGSISLAVNGLLTKCSNSDDLKHSLSVIFVKEEAKPS